MGFLENAIFLEPLNLFFYTWRFLATLELETDTQSVKVFYRLFALISIILLPAGFYAVFISYEILSAKADSNKF